MQTVIPLHFHEVVKNSYQHSGKHALRMLKSSYKWQCDAMLMTLHVKSRLHCQTMLKNPCRDYSSRHHLGMSSVFTWGECEVDVNQ